MGFKSVLKVPGTTVVDDKLRKGELELNSTQMDLVKMMVNGSGDLDLNSMDIDDFNACITALDKVIEDERFADAYEYMQSIRDLWDSVVSHSGF